MLGRAQEFAPCSHAERFCNVLPQPGSPPWQEGAAAPRPIRAGRCASSSPPGRAGRATSPRGLVAAKLTERLGQSFYVENIGGGGGNIAMGTAARAAPDGYTILAATSNLVTNVGLYPKIPYDPDKDFAPISLLCSSPHLLTVHPSVPAQNVNELVALAKASPGKFSFASAGRGTPAHLAGELFKLTFGRRHHACAVQRWRAGHCRHGRRPRAALGAGAADRRDLCARRQPARARLVQQQAGVRAARGADHGGGVRPRSAGRHRQRLYGAFGHAEAGHRPALSRSRESHGHAGHPREARRRWASIRSASTPEEFAVWMQDARSCAGAR